MKETRFFSQDYEKGAAWYQQKYYAAVKEETAIGDISPVYLLDERCPERIYKTLGPEIKLIFMLRDPVDRAYSHYCMLRNHQFEDLSFENALARDKEARVAQSLKHYGHQRGFQYLEESAYVESIERYLSYFDKARVKYVLFEEFVADTKRQLGEILNFLDVTDGHEFEFDVYTNPRTASAASSKVTDIFYNNPLAKKARDLIQLKTGWRTQSLLKKAKTTLLGGSRGKSQTFSLDEKTRGDLYSRFQGEILNLQALSGKDLSIWNKPEL